MQKTTRKPRTKNPLVTSFKIGERTYERQLVDCGKKNCSRCRTPTGRAGSHGPYWYMCALWQGKWRRVYIGKNLDTTRFILPDGAVDWAMALRLPSGCAGRAGADSQKPAGPDEKLKATPRNKRLSILQRAAARLEALPDQANPPEKGPASSPGTNPPP